LVDRPAGFLTAIDLAARAAGFGHGDYRLVVRPEAGGLGGIPTNPLGRIAAWARCALGEDVKTATLPEPLRRVLDLPLLTYESATPLALLPFVFVDE